MWRGTKLESVVERTEFRLQVFFAVACDFKGFDHDIQIVVADSTGGKLHAVADDIILISQDIFRVHGVQCFKAALRHREWVVCEIHLLLVLVVFIHREVVDKTEAEGILLDQVKTFTQFVAELSGKKVSTFFFIRNKENRIAHFKTCEFSKFLPHVIRDKFVNGAFITLIFHDFQVTKAAHTDGSGEFQQFLMKTLGHIGMNPDGTDGTFQERFECTSLKEFCDIHDTQRVSEIRLVRAELQHGILVADHRIRGSCDRSTFRCKFFKSGCQNFFTYTENFFLSSEAHLKVQLIEFAR